MPTVAIFGAGVGGLTCAHELSKVPGMKIDIYERKDSIGGLARSGRDKDGCATETCWRVVFSFYRNLIRVMNEIPLNENPNKCVIDNLTPSHHLNINDTNTPAYDQAKIGYNILYGVTCCDDRLNDLDNLSWADSLKSVGVSTLVKQVAPWLGLDRDKASYNSVIKVGMELDILPKQLDIRDKNFITTKPTSEAWFDHWYSLLNSRGVQFHMNTELVSIEVHNNHVISAHIMDSNGNGIRKIVADYYVFSIPVDVLCQIVNKTLALMHGTLKHAQQLANTCLHMQPCFQLYLNVPISLGRQSKSHPEYNSFLITDTPWDLIVLMYDKIYIDTNLCNNIPGAKTGWSVAACTAYKKGILFGKTIRECTYDEIVNELWAQMIISPKFRKIIYDNNGLYTLEPKFTNNVGSIEMRPSCRTHIDNLFVSTAYTKETINIFSMEAACISGVLTANMIDPRISRPEKVPRPKIFAPARRLDQFCYDAGLPNVSPIVYSLDYLMYYLLSQ
jgi:hypothetical protein